MTESVEEEKVWTWELMEPGLDAPPVTTEITRELISKYARSMQNENPIYFDDEAAKAEGFEGVIAPPTMMFSYAPHDRTGIFNTRGYLDPRQSENPRSTPFVGTEIEYQGIPVYPGDTITSVTRIDRTWQSSSGNRFVSFRVVGHNQRGEKVCNYLYNIIWERPRGRVQKNR